MKWLKLAVSAAIIAGAFVTLRYVAWTPVRCHDVAMNVIRRTQRMEKWTDAIAITIATRENLERIEPCRHDLPWVINLQMLAGANYSAREMHEEAIRVYEEALRYDYRPEIYFNLGMELLKAGHVEESIEPLTIACTVRTDFIDEIPNLDVRGRVMALAARRVILPTPSQR